jgi:hypothetical protein
MGYYDSNCNCIPITGTFSNTIQQLEIYPNPANSEIVVKTDLNGPIHIYDIASRKMMTSKRKEINITSLQEGLYLLQIDKFTKRFLVVR